MRWNGFTLRSINMSNKPPNFIYMNNLRIFAAATVTLIPTLAIAVDKSTPTKPNFVVILLDDSGFADFGCYGGLIPTPNIDALAEKGVRMSQMYNCARSCPTRASLLTGLYPQQAGVGHMVGSDKGKISSAYQGYLNNNCVTLGEVMRENGYYTAMVGKWHVGQNQGATPWGRGFDHVLNAAAGGFYYENDPKAEIYLNGEKIEKGDLRFKKDWYSTDLWTEYANQFISEAAEKRQPFMVYLAYNAPHFPLQAPVEDVVQFKGKFSKGWDVLRREAYERQLKMNLLGKPYALTKRSPLIPLWKDVEVAQRKRSLFTMELYAAIMSHLDTSIGKLVTELKKKDLFEHTVIVILSDNGGNAEGKSVFGTFEGSNPGGWESNIFLGQAWAEVSNTPFFLYKHHTHEGGIATPLVVSYPAGIDHKMNGKIVHQPGHVIDIMATLVEMSSATYPKTYKGNDIIPMQGINLYPIWMGEKPVRSEPLFWEHEDNVALRDGRWKIVKERNEPDWQLYDMEADRTECNDLAQAKPDVLGEMMKKYEKMYDKVGATHINFGKAPRWMVPVKEY